MRLREAKNLCFWEGGIFAWKLIIKITANIFFPDRLIDKSTAVVFVQCGICSVLYAYVYVYVFVQILLNKTTKHLWFFVSMCADVIY